MPESFRPGRPASPAVALAVVLSALPALAGAGGGDEARVVGRPEALVVTPPIIELTGRRDARQLVVDGRYADGPVRDLTALVTIDVDDPRVVDVDPRGYVTPRANGRTTLHLRAGGREAAVPLTVDGLDGSDPVSFRREVVAALNVSGCNAGACHGTPSGKNGFKLSLRGFDPAADYLQLTRDVAGRRISLSDPESSLVLQKGQGQVPHEGGAAAPSRRPRPPTDPSLDLRRCAGRPAWVARPGRDRRRARPAAGGGPLEAAAALGQRPFRRRLDPRRDPPDRLQQQRRGGGSG